MEEPTLADEWDELDNLTGNSGDSNDDGDDDFAIEKLSASERKKYERMRKEVETAIVEEIAKGDTKSGVYKGLQQVLAKRDRELAETRAALAQVHGRVTSVEDKGSEVDFLYNIVRDMLDEDGKKVLEARKEQFSSSRSTKKNEDLLKMLLQERSNPQPAYYPYGQPEEPPEQVQYRKDAEAKLKNLAKMAGVDPNSKDLDMGDIGEPLLIRMGKLEASIERLKDKDIDSVRDSGNRTQTRTDTPSPRRREPVDARNLLDIGAAKMIEEARKVARNSK
jgi:hypothetical protein